MYFKELLGQEMFHDCWQVWGDPSCAGGRAFTDQPNQCIFYFSLLMLIGFVGTAWTTWSRVHNLERKCSKHGALWPGTTDWGWH